MLPENTVLVVAGKMSWLSFAVFKNVIKAHCYTVDKASIRSSPDPSSLACTRQLSNLYLCDYSDDLHSVHEITVPISLEPQHGS